MYLSFDNLEESGEQSKLYEVAEQLIRVFETSKYERLLIPAMACFPEDGFPLPSSLGGIALIKMLRAIGFHKPILLVAPYSAEQLIKQDPKNFILMSKGVACITLSQLTREDFPQLEEIDENYDLTPYFQVDIAAPEDDRHTWANWWGVVTLSKVHDILNSSSMTPSKELKSKELKSKELKSKELKSKEELKSTQCSLQAKILLYRYGFRKGFFDEGSMSELNESDEITPFKQKIKDLDVQIKGKSKDLKVLLIDDQADIGWSDIYKTILYDDDEKAKRGLFRALGIPDETKIVEYMGEEIKDFEPNLIFLDLRLYNSDSNPEKKEKTGIKLLKALRESFVGIPIIITSATNKIETYRLLMDAGATACWSKQALDSSRALSEKGKTYELLDNYYQLLKCIELAQSTLSTFYKNLNDIQKLASNNELWCQKGKWYGNYENPYPIHSYFTYSDYSGVMGEISQISDEELREFLQKMNMLVITELQKRINTFSNDGSFHQEVKVLIGKVLEVVHYYDQSKTKLSFKPFLEWRKDDKAVNLYGQRNLQAHARTSTSLADNEAKVTEKFEGFVNYFMNHANCEKGKKLKSWFIDNHE